MPRTERLAEPHYPACGADLSALAFFSDIPLSDLDRIYDCLGKRAVRAGATLILEKDLKGRVCFVWTGRFTVLLAAPPNKTVFVREHRRGDAFNILPAILQVPWGDRVRVTCEEGGLLLELPEEQFHSFLSMSPAFIRAVLRSMALAAADQGSRHFELSALDARDRVIAELLRLCRSGEFNGRKCIVRQPPSQREMAERVCAAREVVSRILATLTKAGLLKRGRGILEIHDVEKLLDMHAAKTGQRMFDPSQVQRLPSAQ